MWRYVTRNVTPLPRRGVKHPPPPQNARLTTRSGEREPPLPLPEKTARQSTDIDRSTDEKLRRGQMPIDGRIDLHGMGLDEAHETLARFLLSGHHHGRRCVLVITGKGREGRGVLRQKFPQWMKEEPIAPIVLRFYPAKPQHGGSGAFYVLLRRRRE